jgi:hypothetical protein
MKTNWLMSGNGLFEISKDEITSETPCSEEIKKRIGKKLYNEVENLEIYIRDRVTQPFIMRGTYHDLSNKITNRMACGFL